MAGRRRMRAALRGKAPGLVAERGLWDAGHRVVAGLDEVGRGAWAGPLTVGVVVPDRNRRITGVRDSKMLTEPEREALFDRITGWAEAWSVGHASNDECDDLGMSDAHAWPPAGLSTASASPWTGYSLTAIGTSWVVDGPAPS